jgi:hypothetical protein
MQVSIVEQFIEQNGLLPVLFRGATEPPTLWRAVKRFREGTLNIREDARQV